MTSDRSLTQPSSAADVAAFIRRSRDLNRASGNGRLLFALDATASRQPTWDRACQLQGEMFTEAAQHSGLRVQLLWYRGFAEFRAEPWAQRADQLLTLMRDVHCAGGATQIARVLGYALRATRSRRVAALVFVGDCMEENPDELYALAGQLKLLRLPAFMFHEGGDERAAVSFRRIAELSGGAYCRFDSGSASELRALLRAVAAYASGGRAALADLSRRGHRGGRELLEQL